MIILASQSPRRREILQNAGIPFQVRVAAVEEKHEPGEQPHSYVERLAQSKALAVQMSAGEIILGADTTVLLDDQILEKPVDREDAVRMLRLLSGRDHQVLTAICLRHPAGLLSAIAETTVTFHPLTEAEIQQYAETGEPMDKAGAYGIQGLASKFIKCINGCYFNVVGLPVSLLYQQLKQLDSGV